jgi:hypothetical protein
MLYTVSYKLHPMYVIHCIIQAPAYVCYTLYHTSSTLCMLYTVSYKLHPMYVIHCIIQAPPYVCHTLYLFYSTLDFKGKYTSNNRYIDTYKHSGGIYGYFLLYYKLKVYFFLHNHNTCMKKKMKCYFYN